MSYFDEMVAKDLIKEVRELRKNYEKAAEKSQGVVATVNLSLHEYLEMYEERYRLYQEIESLKAARDAVGLLLSKIDIPIEELKIDPKSIDYHTDVDMLAPDDKRHIVRFSTIGLEGK